MEWSNFWSEFPNKFPKDEFLRQVGKTYKGKPITDDQLKEIVLDIKNKLYLKPDDMILDLCCGNGIITREIAKKCSGVTGVDYSKPLIDIANEYFYQSNIKYLNISALNINREILMDNRLFSKVYMYEALQHFQENQLELLLKAIFTVSCENRIILFASIPDKDKIWLFYNTPELKRDYLLRKENGELLLGTWWNKKIIEETCLGLNLKCEFLEQPESFHTAYYRFDVRITN